MPSGRTLLAALGTGGACAVAGRPALGRPELRLARGVGVLHPAAERDVRNGLRPNGPVGACSRVAPDRAPGVVGPDASTRRSPTAAREGPLAAVAPGRPAHCAV